MQRVLKICMSLLSSFVTMILKNNENLKRERSQKHSFIPFKVDFTPKSILGRRILIDPMIVSFVILVLYICPLQIIMNRVPKPLKYLAPPINPTTNMHIPSSNYMHFKCMEPKPLVSRFQLGSNFYWNQPKIQKTSKRIL
jgi:hypothetical protein